VEVQQAPEFTLEHVEGHPVSLSDFRGRTVVVAFSSKDNTDQIAQGIETLRTQFDPESLPVIAIADLRGVPRPARMIAKKKLKGAYDEAVQKAIAQHESAGLAPRPGHELVVMLPDWGGDVAPGFGIPDVDQEAAMVLVDKEGRVRGVARGAGCGQEVIGMFRS